VKYVDTLKVTSHALTSVGADDSGGKSPFPDSPYNRPDDTVGAAETDPLDAVPIFGRFKESSEAT
jgi:hypothetical protein